MASVLFGMLVGAIPTAAMLLASLLLSKISVSPVVEAFFQNYAGGLILAAVAAELFPLMLDAPKGQSMIGITIGFAIGISLVFGLDSLVEILEVYIKDLVLYMNTSESSVVAGDLEAENSSKIDAEKVEIFESSEGTLTFPKEYEFDGEDLQRYSEVNDASKLLESPQKVNSKRVPLEIEDSSPHKHVKLMSESDGSWALEPLRNSSVAFQDPHHRSHIESHMREIDSLIQAMDTNTVNLFDHTNGFKYSQIESEVLAEKIDEDIHILQYKVDHVKRLLEGSECEIRNIEKKNWMSDDRKNMLRQRVKNLKLISEHVLEHLSSNSELLLHASSPKSSAQSGKDGVIVSPFWNNDISNKIDSKYVALLHELYTHMSDMDIQINKVHENVERVVQKWHRVNSLMDPEEGATLPLGLIVPVTVDCFVDGFLIGVSCALSHTAGIILGAANCLEMSFLGMAYTTRIMKCTGSTLTNRRIAIYCPPLLMFLSSGFGALVGNAASAVPAIFVTFVAFGVVALLFLACCELFIEAKEVQGENEKWYLTATIFLGVYTVLVINQLVG